MTLVPSYVLGLAERRRQWVYLLLALFLLTGGVGHVRAQPETTSVPDPDTIGVTDAVTQAIETYPSVQAARREVDAADARTRQARSRYWPRVSAVGTYRRQDPVPEITIPGAPTGSGGGGESIGIQANNLYDGHVQVQQTLYDFGKTSARVEQAEAGRTAAQRRVAVERSDLAFRAIDAFYGTLLAEARIEVQRKQIDQLEETLAVVQRRTKAGTATEFEVQSTRTRLSATRSQLTHFQSQRQREEAELRRFLGRRPDADLALRGTIDPSRWAADSTRIDADSLARRALQTHPSVRAARAQVQAARRQVHVADESDAPTLALTAQGGIKNGYPDDLSKPRLNESIGLSLNVPLFEGFATRRKTEEAQAQVQTAEARLTDVQRQVGTQVEQAASSLRALLDRLATTNLRVEQAQSAAQLARSRYEAGTITNLELLEAETELQRARLTRTERGYEVVMARYALRRAAGTLLPFPASTP